MPSAVRENVVYILAQCSTCRKALEFLKERGVPCRTVAIREQPPGVPELKRMLDLTGGSVSRLFNTSGMDYRAMGLKEKVPAMSTEEALALLASNGSLVRRPFLLTASGKGATGFRQPEWEALFPG